MKIFDGIKDFFFSAEEDDFDQMEPPVVRTEREPVEHSVKSIEREEAPSQASVAAAMAAATAASAAENPAAANIPGRRNKVVNIQTTAQLQVVLVKPSAFTDAKQIADHLIAKKTVVLNLETASPENKRRIIDFLVGVAYANGGSLKPVANLTYIITPYNVGFIGEDLVGELENNGVFI